MSWVSIELFAFLLFSVAMLGIQLGSNTLNHTTGDRENGYL